MVVCVLLPRFALAVAARSHPHAGGEGRERLLGRPVALAPEPGREQLVGEVSPAAEAFGVRAGMRLGEALARCPELALLPPDPAGVEDAWEAAVGRLEGIGAAVECPRPGAACFEARGLRRLHGGGLEGVIGAARRALRAPARIGVGPSRFAAMALATRARARRAQILPDGEAGVRVLAGLPVDLLALRPEVIPPGMPAELERLGIHSLGELARLSRASLADRFGSAGPRAHDLARGRDTALVPRDARERLEESLELPEAASGSQLERALDLLIGRLLARHERRGRALRCAVLSARLVEGGTWRERVAFREAVADPVRIRLALANRLAGLPGPAESLRLAAERLGPPAGDQRGLLEEAAAARDARLREAVRQTRAVAGPDAALRVLLVDPDSRVPERRAVLAPFEG